MSEYNVELLEQTVKNNVDDVRELKQRMGSAERDVNDLKANHQVTQQAMTHVMETLTNLKSDFKSLDSKIDESNKEFYKSNINQLKQYKTTVWSMGGMIIGSIIVAVVLFFLKI